MLSRCPRRTSPWRSRLPELAPLLKRLRLSGILDSLETRNREAVANKMPYTGFLALLVADEVARREHKKFNLRIRRAGFRSSKTLEQFDFDFNAAIDQTLITDLTTCRFVAEKVAILIAGPCGNGGASPMRPDPSTTARGSGTPMPNLATCCRRATTP